MIYRSYTADFGMQSEIIDGFIRKITKTPRRKLQKLQMVNKCTFSAKFFKGLGLIRVSFLKNILFPNFSHD